MTTDRAASIRQKLHNLAREREEDFDYVLRQYVMQRWVIGDMGYRGQTTIKKSGYSRVTKVLNV